jgi:phosphoserine phosphatase
MRHDGIGPLRRPHPAGLLAGLAALTLLAGCERPATKGPAVTSAPALSSWNDGAAKSALTSFVRDVTTEGGPRYVAPAERVAVFDNDGTLWSEQPISVQLAFVADRVKALAPQHPEWRQTQPFKGVLEGDLEAVAGAGEHGLVEMLMATHAGMTTEEFEAVAKDWIATARHPKTGRPYTEMVYRPMLELLDDLRAHGFKTFIVSGGGVEFMRPWTESVYGIPPEQVVGSRIETRFEMRDGMPVLVRLPQIAFVDDKEGKPVGIHAHVGRRPILAFGNSDGDLQMLQWTTVGHAPSLGLILHRTDGEREAAYDRESSIGHLDRALDEAPERGWVVVDMKRDWRTVFP